MNRRGLLGRSAVALLAVLLLGGCGGGSDTGEPVETDHDDLPPSYRFAPEVIQVTAGTAVTWTNNDHFTHTVQFDDGDYKIEPGESVAITFETPGEYDYTCT
ncbi:MAG: cupredoxin domain-containing protein, partial [Vicinamibacterales bacterium]